MPEEGDEDAGNPAVAEAGAFGQSGAVFPQAAEETGEHDNLP